MSDDPNGPISISSFPISSRISDVKSSGNLEYEIPRVCVAQDPKSASRDVIRYIDRSRIFAPTGIWNVSSDVRGRRPRLVPATEFH